ncbi:rhodanese-like domain-containing protein [Coraliomargarita sp. SDUM461004]|uniref:Rhodanese-like domain-containing protein n=1 Tax=Thalassobacterium sedimentorum TaxID=3041258 RepID=A0ABU1AFH4_9BACT|nr:rhodanese-like domain-containing protein [Coraliomargarita sp. SDUM461004]MDQ8193569.1 rhodanese-like domain-containing protein [Coraliomargarita sp. SDUM461004]
MNKEISATDAANLRVQDPTVVLLDVREDSELEICRIDGALHIPMGEIPNRYESLPRKVPLIVLCHHGMRSMNVVQYLTAKGFENTINLAGGIHAWACEVAPEMRRY